MLIGLSRESERNSLTCTCVRHFRVSVSEECAMPLNIAPLTPQWGKRCVESIVTESDLPRFEEVLTFPKTLLFCNKRMFRETVCRKWAFRKYHYISQTRLRRPSQCRRTKRKLRILRSFLKGTFVEGPKACWITHFAVSQQLFHKHSLKC